ncbi:MAG: NAD(P)/FAD-dependent oxidoreductase [Sphingobacteriales bacterium]|nr:MAG: NAD(P)/FAD-dependent oxidoreductase [Sphingobacteriales bacterium]
MRATNFDVIIVGGSYAGLAAGMALGRALKQVLIIDDGKPCNRQTPQLHNFLTNDGKKPSRIAGIAKTQVSLYKTVQFITGTAVQAYRTERGFKVTTDTQEKFQGKNLVFATGIKDVLPAIEGLADSWGISVLHCPYCHGYEVRDNNTGVMAAGVIAFDFTKLISNWTDKLTLFTNGDPTLTTAQRAQLSSHSIPVVEKEIEELQHDQGHVQRIVFKDGSTTAIGVIYAPVPFEQHCDIPAKLGCELNEEGYIKTNDLHETTVPGVYAIGDNSSKMRTVANAVANGTGLGMTMSKRMILESY